MKRRQLLKLVALAGAGAGLPAARLHASESGYSGRLLVTLQADGGWDVSSFCDPKVNTPGEPVINNWAFSGGVQTAGNIPYAPFAANQGFFQKYFQQMLVINGVDAQTNAHSVGVLHNWSGRNSAGYPTLSAMFATRNGSDLPLSYLNNGGYSETAQLIRFNRLSSPYELGIVLEPNNLPWDRSRTWWNQDSMSLVEQAQQARLQSIVDDNAALPRVRYNAASYLASLQSKDALRAFADILPSEDQFPNDVNLGQTVGSSSLQRQIMMSILAFKAGVSSAADLFLGGFDTHAGHDPDHHVLLTHLTDSIDFFWQYAQQQGVADRITLVIGSDFSRTPFYNSGAGKDHWPIGSVIIMEQNPAWGNRVVGLTDGAQNAYKINPQTLKVDDSGGTIIYPKHVHKALRRYLGLEGDPRLVAFPLNNTEDFDFFNPSKST